MSLPSPFAAASASAASIARTNRGIRQTLRVPRTVRLSLTISKVAMTLTLMTACVAGGCGSNDSATLNDLRTQVAALQTQAAQPTATPLFRFVPSTVTPTAEPDRVVGIEWHCTGLISDWSRQVEFQEPECVNSSVTPGTGAIIVNRRQLLTVRTSQGTTYIIAESPTTKVRLGDAWPPAPP